MPETKTYLLQLLFDAGQIEIADLEARVKTAIVDPASLADLRLETTGIGHLLSLRGPLERVDECHHQLNTALLGADPLSGVRLVDEAGDEVRNRAYPILSNIEQALRSFVNRKAVEILGFGWWDRHAPAAIQAKVSRSIGRDAGVTLLEGTQFDDLVKLITYEDSEWAQDKTLTVAELSQLMASCSGFEEFQTRLAAKTARFSLWDKVFAPYFNDLRQWNDVKSVLALVIRERHKVMHHRPMRLATLAVLAAKEEEITALFGASKLTLPQPERERVQQEVEQAMLASEQAHRAEVEQLARQLPADARAAKFFELFQQRQHQWVQDTLPSPQQLAKMQEALFAILPSEEELKRNLERIQALLPTAEEAQKEAERTSKMLTHALDQSQSLVNTAQMRNMVVPDPKLVEQIQSIQKNTAPVKAALEHLQRYHGRRGF